MTAPRPTDDIRADLALMKAHSVTAPGRLLADVPSLLDRLAAVERERDEARRIGRLDWQEANNLLVWAEGAEERVNAAVARAEAAEGALAAAQTRADRLRAFVASQAITARALGAWEWERRMLDRLHADDASLAAPSPQAEPATRCEHGYTAGHRRQRYDHMQGESVELPRCPGPQSTEETGRG